MKESLGAKTLMVPAPVWLVGTYDADGRPNLMAAAWAGICCGDPPCLTVSLRKATYSYGSIVARQAFTLSVPSEAQAAVADYVGMVSGRDAGKFAAAGLTPVRSDLVDAPYPGEMPLVAECRLLHTLEIGLHTAFVGEILDVKADAEVCADGAPDIEKVRPLLFSPGARVYHGVGSLVGKGWHLGKSIGSA